MLLDIPITKNALVYMNGKRIFVQHGHDLPANQATDLTQRFKVDILISGHTHLPALQCIENVLMLNPGSPGMSKREDGQGTIAIIQDNKVEIIAVKTGEILQEDTIGPK
jgi:putative phosphoesterase